MASKCTGVGFKARRQHNDVELVMVLRGTNPRLGDLNNRLIVFDIDQLYIIAIEGSRSSRDREVDVWQTVDSLWV